MTNINVKMNRQLAKAGNQILKNHGLSPQQGMIQFYEYLAETSQLPFPSKDADGKLTEIPQVTLHSDKDRKDWFDDEFLDY